MPSAAGVIVYDGKRGVVLVADDMKEAAGMTFVDPERCSRCGKERPDDASAQGWTIFEDDQGNFVEVLCGGCHTADEQIRGIPDVMPEEWGGHDA